MGFDAEGFLGADALGIVDKQRIAYPDLFAFAEECSSTAMKVALLPISTDSRGLSVGVMLSRCIAQFQGAIVLVERGLTIESMVLSRALYETAFVLGALAKNGVTPEELVGSDFGNRKTIGNALLPTAKKVSSLAQSEKLEVFISENAEKQILSIYEMARRAEMLKIYDGVYRLLSHFAAHPSVTSANGYYFEQSDGSGRVGFHPLLSDTPKSILAACTGIMLACGSFETASIPNSGINAEIRMRLDIEETLYQKYRPWGI